MTPWGCFPQMLVFDRREPIERVIETSKAKLHMRKKAKGAAVLDGEEVLHCTVSSTLFCTRPLCAMSMYACHKLSSLLSK